MKRFIVGISVLFISTLVQAQECFDKLDGSEDAKYDSSTETKLIRLGISKFGQQAYIATEYIGSANLQATIYLRKKNKYCFAGDLGSFSGYKLDKNKARQGYYSINVLSKSGPVKFIRKYHFDSGMYVQYHCQKFEKNDRKLEC